MQKTSKLTISIYTATIPQEANKYPVECIKGIGNSKGEVCPPAEKLVFKNPVFSEFVTCIMGGEYPPLQPTSMHTESDTIHVQWI